jgi:hypothetical protein
MPVTIDGTSGITTPDLESAGQVTSNGLTTSLYPLISDTAKASTSGTSIDFTSIPSWVKRITVMFGGVSVSGTSNFLVQLGTGGAPTTSGYAAGQMYVLTSGASSNGSTATNGFPIQSGDARYTLRGSLVFSLLNSSSNLWAGSGVMYNDAIAPYINSLAGSIALSGTLDRIRITTVNGTDTFDAGSINILYE